MTISEIVQFAERAALSACDAFADSGHVPSAETVYEFIREMESESAGEDSDVNVAPAVGSNAACDAFDQAYQAKWDALEMSAREFDLFESVYALKCAELKAASEVAQ